MPKNLISKAKPVAVSSPVIDCEHYVDLNRQKKVIENEMTSMKPRIYGIVPEGQDKELLDAVRDGTTGHYVITRIEQDRRKIDDDALATKLKEKGLYVWACKTVPDHEKVAKLIEDGLFPAEELADCMTGSVVKFATCDFKALK